MRLRKEPGIQVKSPEQIARMYAAGQVVARTLSVLKESVRPGVTTAELDAIAEREIRQAGAKTTTMTTMKAASAAKPST